MKQFIYFYKE